MMSLTKFLTWQVYATMYRTDERALDGDDGFISNSSFLGVAFNTEDDPYDSIGLGRLTLKSLKNKGGGLR